MSDIKIESSAQKVENEKTKKQADELKQAKEAKKAADAKAREAAKESAKKDAAAKSEKEKPASSKKEGRSALADSLTDVAKDAIAKGSKSKTIKNSKFIAGLIIGLIAGALIIFIIGKLSPGMIFGTNHTSQTTADEVLENGVLGYTAVDFQDAVLKEASRHTELVVMEQPLEISTTVTKAGLANLQIFSKVKTITYYGTGVYTVDLSQLKKDKIVVDAEKKEVKIVIPHSCLQYIEPDLDKTEFEDTEKGLLSFGDIKLKTEDQNRLMQAVRDSMKERLTKEDVFEQADEYAQMSTWQIFQPLISAVSPEYTVEIEFDENTEHLVTAA